MSLLKWFSKLSTSLVFGPRTLPVRDALMAVTGLENISESRGRRKIVRVSHSHREMEPLITTCVTHYLRGAKSFTEVIEARYTNPGGKLSEGRYTRTGGVINPIKEDYRVTFNPPGSFFGIREDLLEERGN